MTTIIEAIAWFSGHPEELMRLTEPPVDALQVETELDRRFNVQLATCFAVLLEQPTVTHQIHFLHTTADEDEIRLSGYASRLLLEDAVPVVTPAVWQKKIDTIRAWATAIHEHAMAQHAAA